MDNGCVPNLCNDPNSSMMCNAQCADDCTVSHCSEHRMIMCKCKVGYKKDAGNGTCVYFKDGYVGFNVGDDIVEDYSTVRNISNPIVA